MSAILTPLIVPLLRHDWDELGRTYLEDEFDEWAVEQPSSWAAEAEVAARPSLTAGLVGVDLKDLRLAARRATDPSDLASELQPWAHLFRGADPGGARVKTVVLAAMAIGLTVEVASPPTSVRRGRGVWLGVRQERRGDDVTTRLQPHDVAAPRVAAVRRGATPP